MKIFALQETSYLPPCRCPALRFLQTMSRTYSRTILTMLAIIRGAREQRALLVIHDRVLVPSRVQRPPADRILYLKLKFPAHLAIKPHLSNFPTSGPSYDSHSSKLHIKARNRVTNLEVLYIYFFTTVHVLGGAIG